MNDLPSRPRASGHSVFCLLILGLTCALPACYRQQEVPTRATIPAAAVERLAQAKQSMAEGDPEAAIVHLNETIDQAPGLGQAYVLRGMLREGQGDAEAREDYEQAAACYDRALEQDPKSLDTAMDRCVALYLWRGQAAALHAVNDLLRDYPDYQPAASLRERIENNNRAYFINTAAPTNTEAADGS